MNNSQKIITVKTKNTPEDDLIDVTCVSIDSSDNKFFQIVLMDGTVLLFSKENVNFIRLETVR